MTVFSHDGIYIHSKYLAEYAQQGVNISDYMPSSKTTWRIWLICAQSKMRIPMVQKEFEMLLCPLLCNNSELYQKFTKRTTLKK